MRLSALMLKDNRHCVALFALQIVFLVLWSQTSIWSSVLRLFCKLLIIQLQFQAQIITYGCRLDRYRWFQLALPWYSSCVMPSVQVASLGIHVTVMWLLWIDDTHNMSACASRCGWFPRKYYRLYKSSDERRLYVRDLEPVFLCFEVCVSCRPVPAALQTASIWLFLFSFFFFLFFFLPLSEALGTINPTDYSAPLLLDWTFTISRGRQQWGPDESNIHGISFTLLPLSHAPPPLCQAPVWWEGLLTLAAPIDRQFCKDGPQQPYQTPDAPPLFFPRLCPPKIGDKIWLERGAETPAVWCAGGFVLHHNPSIFSKETKLFFFFFFF